MDQISKRLLTSTPFGSFYNIEWIEQAATKGFDEFYKTFLASLPEKYKQNDTLLRHRISILYYTAFESALNIFLQQAIQDSLTDVELCLDELGKLTARIKKNKKTRKK